MLTSMLTEPVARGFAGPPIPVFGRGFLVVFGTRVVVATGVTTGVAESIGAAVVGGAATGC